MLYFLFQCLKAKGKGPIIPPTHPSIPMTHPLSSPLQWNLKVNLMKSRNIANTRDMQRVNGQKRKGGNQRKRRTLMLYFLSSGRFDSYLWPLLTCLYN